MTPSKIQFCSKGSWESGESPIGSAWYTPELIMCELPLPWGADVLRSRNIPHGLADMVQRTYDLRGYDWGMIGYAPDEAWSIPGMNRVIHAVVLPGTVGKFHCTTYLIPHDDLVDALDALLRESEHPALVPQSSDDTRDVFLCTHGTVDTCCATFGYPMYALMRKMADNPDSNVRVWRATHFGGHRFAPTYLEMPTGRYWGRIKPHDASALMHHSIPPLDARHLYRGSATLPDALHQAIEGELFARIGWDLDTATIHRIDIEETNPGLWTALAEISLLDGTAIVFEIACRQIGEITLRGHCNYEIDITSPQFELSSTRR